jgi:hypothetical protein
MHEGVYKKHEAVPQAQGCGALRSCARESTLHVVPRASRGTPVSDRMNGSLSGETSPGNPAEPAKSSKLSRCAAIYGRRDRSIRENIIGHRMRAARRIAGLRFARLRRVLNPQRAFALLHQPSREQSGGVFVQPGIEQLANFLAEIGGVAEPRKFVALKRIPRSRQKKLPWRLRFLDGHRCLLRGSYFLL